MSGPEEATQYLQRTNFKTLIEWLTATSILHRPEDPLQFCSDLLLGKLEERAGVPYDPEQPAEYARATYAEASAAADEHGRISREKVSAALADGKNKEGEDGNEKHLSPKEQAEAALAAATSKLKGAEKMLEAARSLALQLDPIEAMETLMEESKALLGAEQAILFVADHNDEVLRPANGKPFEIPFGTGICGQAAASGEVINILDAQTDERYDVRSDEDKGYTTRTILCGPISDAEGQIQGVLQVDNKIGAKFDDADKEHMGMLTMLGGIALKNSRLYKEAERSNNKLQALVDIVKSIQSSDTMGINHLLFSLTMGIPKIVDADKCSIFVVDKKNNNLWSMQGDINITIPIDKGVIGAAATSGQIVNIPDAYADSRFNQDVDKQEGYKTRNILCIPIKDDAGQSSGVIQLINKKEGIFLPEDEIILGLFIAVAAPILNNSQLFESVSSGGIVSDPAKKKVKEEEGPKSPLHSEASRKRLSSKAKSEIIEESEEEDGDN
mmetsp:Transcript_4238/g.5855  ORF Transcript_4238/g.5855 Transcript_4238/m.5855 type:complete len:499 (-) Transcript_4238:164-1660(-)